MSSLQKLYTGYPILDHRLFDKLVYKLMERGFYVSRHSYSYRVFYRDKIVAGIHVYPGFNEVSVRLYRVFRDIAYEAMGDILGVVREVFRGYKVRVAWYP